MYPLSSALGLKAIHHGPGFDCLDLQKHLGDVRYDALIQSIIRSGSALFCCNHRKYEKGHTDPRFATQDGGPIELGGTEVHCVYAADLEAFLKSEAR